MKVLFAGPSLWGQDVDTGDLEVCPPARQGDLHRAVLDGATAIGLVDGVFGFVPSVWHKEILHALSEGVRVLGAASLGALRSAECHAFGMEAIGTIARDYLSGVRNEDADVCLAHAPAELDFMPLSEPLVDVEATLAAMPLPAADRARLLQAARELYFADRTIEAMLARAGLPAELGRLYRDHRVTAKARDALELVVRLRSLPDAHTTPPADWSFRPSGPWRHYLAGLP